MSDITGDEENIEDEIIFTFHSHDMLFIKIVCSNVVLVLEKP